MTDLVDRLVLEGQLESTKNNGIELFRLPHRNFWFTRKQFEIINEFETEVRIKK